MEVDISIRVYIEPLECFVDLVKLLLAEFSKKLCSLRALAFGTSGFPCSVLEDSETRVEVEECGKRVCGEEDVAIIDVMKCWCRLRCGSIQ